MALVGTIAASGTARAVDGVREINQASVSGAANVLHIISQPGSYRLTSDLLAPSSASGIRIDVSDVTLDLNGFTITSGGGVPLSVHGITGSSLTNVEIRNGTIRNFPTSGVHLANGVAHRVIDVRIVGSQNFGINLIGTSAAYGGHLIRGCTVSGNGTGMRVEPAGSVVLDSVARANTNTGLLLGTGVGYGGSAASGNGTDVTGGVAIGCNVIGIDSVCPP